MTAEWTPERTAALITLWTHGVSASKIGARLGVTKNAVIGKAFRLQLPKRRPSASDPSDEQSVIRLERLGKDMCSWPLGGSENGGFHFCGAAALPGKPYCQAHCREAYLPAGKDRRAAVA